MPFVHARVVYVSHAGINASLDTAGALMQGMMKRIWGNKIVLGFVMVVLVGGIVAVIFLRFFYPWGASSSTATTAPATNTSRY